MDQVSNSSTPINNDEKLSDTLTGNFQDTFAKKIQNDFLRNATFKNQANYEVNENFNFPHNYAFPNNEIGSVMHQQNSSKINLFESIDNNFKILNNKQTFFPKNKNISIDVNVESLDSVLKRITELFNLRSDYIHNLINNAQNDLDIPHLTDELERIAFENDQLFECKEKAFLVPNEIKSKIKLILNDLESTQNEFEELIKKEISVNEINNFETEKKRRQLMDLLKVTVEEIAQTDLQIVNKQFQIDELMIAIDETPHSYESKNNFERVGELKNELNFLINQKNVLNYKLEDTKRELYQDSYEINQQKGQLESLIKAHEDKLKFYSNELLEKYDDLVEWKQEIINGENNNELSQYFTPIYEYINVRNIEIDNIINSIETSLDNVNDFNDPLYNSYYGFNHQNSEIFNEKECLELQLKALSLIKREVVFSLDKLAHETKQKIDLVRNLLLETQNNSWAKSFISKINNINSLSNEFNLGLNHFDIRNFLNKKKQEVDDLLIVANKNLINLAKKEIDNTNVKNILTDLQKLKSRVDDLLKIFNQTNQINTSELIDIQGEISKNEVYLENLYSPTKNSINQFNSNSKDLETAFKNQKLSFENFMEKNLKDLRFKFDSLKDALSQIKSNTSHLLNKINESQEKINNPSNPSISIPDANQNIELIKKQSLDIKEKNEQFVKDSEILTKSIDLLKEEIENKAKELNDIKSINQNQKDLFNNRFTNNATNSEILNLFLAFQDFVSRSNAFKQLATKNPQSINYNNEAQEINKYQQNVEKIYNDFEDKITDYRSELIDLKTQINNLVNVQRNQNINHSDETNKLLNNVNYAINRMNLDKELFFNKMNDMYKTINQKYNVINEKTNALVNEFNSLQQNSSKQNNPYLEQTLEKIFNLQNDLISEKEQLQHERNYLLRQLRDYENVLRNNEKQIKEIQMNRQQSINEEIRRDYNYKINEIQNLINLLSNERNNFERFKQRELDSLQNRYQELQKFEHENNLIRTNLNNDIYAFKLNYQNLKNTNQEELNRQWEFLSERQKQLEEKERKFEFKYINLFNDLKRMKQDLDNKSIALVTQERANYENYLNQLQHDNEINSILKHIDSERNKLSSDKYNLLQSIHREHANLNLVQRDLDKQSEEIKKQLDNLQLSQKNTFQNNLKLKEKYANLEAKRIQLEKANSDINLKRQATLNKLRNFEKELLEKSKFIDEQQNLLNQEISENKKIQQINEIESKNLQQAYFDLMNERYAFDAERQKTIEKIEDKYNFLKNFELQNNQIRYELDHNYQNLNHLRYATDAEREELEKRNKELIEKHKKLNNKEKDLAKQRSYLFNMIESMKRELFEKNQKLAQKEHSLHVKSEMQAHKDQEIRDIMNRLERNQAQFDQERNEELNWIRGEQMELDNRQKLLDDQAKEINNRISKLKNLKHKTLITKQKYDQDFKVLEQHKNKISEKASQLEEYRQNVLNQLRNFEQKLAYKEQLILIEKQRLQKVDSDQVAKFKELEQALQSLNAQRGEFDNQRNKELDKINEEHRKIEKRELALRSKIREFQEKSSKLNDRKNLIFNDELRLKHQYEQCLMLKQAIVAEQSKLDQAKARAVANLQRFNKELDAKKSKLKSLYNKVKKADYEQKLKQKEIDITLQQHKDKVEDLNKAQESLKQKEAKFEKQRQEKVKYLNKLYKALLQRESDLEMVREELLENKNNLDAKSKELEQEKQKIAEATIKDPKQLLCDHHANKGVHHMHNSEINTICPICQHNNQQEIKTSHDQRNSLINPLIQMQRLVQQQQIQLMKQEHRFEIREANRKREEIENKLKDVIAAQQLEAQKQESRRIIHEEESVMNKLLRALAYDTRAKFKEMNRVLNELKNDRKQVTFSEEEINSFNKSKNEQIKNNDKILEELKDIIAKQVAQFDEERKLLAEEYKQKDQERISKFERKERQLKEMLVEMRNNFNNQLNLMREDKNRLAEKMWQHQMLMNQHQYQQQQQHFANNNTNDNNVHEAQNILEETKKILAKERQKYAQEREQIIRNSYLNDLAKKNKAKNIQSEKQMQIQKLTDEIKNIKDLLDN